MKFLLILLLCSILLVSASTPRRRIMRSSGSVVLENKKFRFSNTITLSAVATGHFINHYYKTGWSELSISTCSKYSDVQQSFAAGFIEGVLTQIDIWRFYSFVSSTHHHSSLIDYFTKQDAFLRQSIEKIDPKSSDESSLYFYQVGLVLAQLDGLMAGYNSVAPPEQQLRIEHFYLINSDGDMMDLERALTPGRRFKPVSEMSRTELIELTEQFGHCTALIKHTSNDLLVAHSTWDDYSEMIRVFKHFNFAFHHKAIRGNRISFSSYPGLLSSTDDFIIINPTKLVVIETTINILDESLYRKVSPSSTVLSWIRLTVANRLAKTGKDWAHYFSKYNSGSYNCQWFVIDYKLFSSGSALRPNTILMLEQIPGMIHASDISSLVQRQGFFPSFNRPYYNDIVHSSMYSHYADAAGEDMFSFNTAPRYKILKREQAKIRTLSDMKRVIRYNNWQTDPFSLGCPGYSIAARFDLSSTRCRDQMSPRASGAIDGKVLSSSMVSRSMAHVIGGPTHASQYPFSWKSSRFSKEYHDGQPNSWNFDWFSTVPKHIISKCNK